MKSQSARQALAPAHSGVRLSLIAALLIAGVALSGAAFAATSSPLGDCDRLGSELRSLDVPASELPLEDAGLHDSEQDHELAVLSSGDSPLDAKSLATPVLMLTPRVANIMREVFGALPIDVETAVDEAITDEKPNGPASEDRMAPVVKAPPAVFPGAIDADAGQNHFIPRFQRQMYRTDI